MPSQLLNTSGSSTVDKCARDVPRDEGTEKVEVDRELNELLRQQFLLDDVGTFTGPIPEPKDIERAKTILKSTSFKIGGRFITGLLWKNDSICFPDSRPMALKRLFALEKKLEKDPELKIEVHKQIRDYVENGFAHIASPEELRSADPNRVWYLPLNIVSHPKKPTKKRLVWDAAAKVGGMSLNSQLLKGPDLLVMLPRVLCTFRQRRIAFGGDIEKMFHQIRIKKEDTHSQRFLFRFEKDQDPKTYLMEVATFGATCSPCSAQYIMHRNADECANEYPIAAAAIKRSTYMDDYFDSCDTREEAIERAKQVRLIG